MFLDLTSTQLDNANIEYLLNTDLNALFDQLGFELNEDTEPVEKVSVNIDRSSYTKV